MPQYPQIFFCCPNSPIPSKCPNNDKFPLYAPISYLPQNILLVFQFSSCVNTFCYIPIFYYCPIFKLPSYFPLQPQYSSTVKTICPRPNSKYRTNFKNPLHPNIKPPSHFYSSVVMQYYLESKYQAPKKCSLRTKAFKYFGLRLFAYTAGQMHNRNKKYL